MEEAFFISTEEEIEHVVKLENDDEEAIVIEHTDASADETTDASVAEEFKTEIETIENPLDYGRVTLTKDEMLMQLAQVKAKLAKLFSWMLTPALNL